ncbi:MAG: thioredoxin-disulfide reductase [Kiritimatiellia bacterium]
MLEKMIIVGSGPAGCTAALYAARAGLKPLVLEGLEPGGQLTTTTEIENFPGFPEAVTGPELMDRMKRQAERFGARFQAAAVTGSDFSKRPLRLFLEPEQTLEGRTVVVAAGASARWLGLESEQALRGKGASACATCDGAFFRNVPVAVVGGGDTALEEALFLTRFASRVFLVHRRREFRASPIMVERALAHPKIEPVLDQVVETVLDVSKNTVTGLALRHVISGERRTLPVGGLFVAIGHEPNTAAFRGQLELNPAGYIRTEGVRTGVAGVYAAGDVRDPVYRQAVVAAGDGCMASLEATRFLEEAGL